MRGKQRGKGAAMKTGGKTALSGPDCEILGHAVLPTSPPGVKWLLVCRLLHQIPRSVLMCVVISCDL